MPEFRFTCPVEVRYGDLDPQGHVNNAAYLTYLEQARVAYFTHLGLWDGRSFMDIGIILADVHLTFLAPIQLWHKVQAGLRFSRLGNKSLTMEYSLEEADTKQVFATATSVLVAYNYHNEQTMPIPDRWRQIITDYEHYPRN
jgi:acyl-CoA thioester hydrolase